MPSEDFHPQIPAAIGRFEKDGDGYRFIPAPVTDEEIAEAKRHTDAMRIAHKVQVGMELTACEMRVAIAGQTEAIARIRLEADPDDAEAKEGLLKALRDQGKIREALEIDPSHAGLLDGAAALQMNDEHFDCGCTDPETHVESWGRAVTTSRWYYKEVHYPAEYGGTVRLWICSLCGFKNISPSVPPGYDDRARHRAFNEANHVSDMFALNDSG